ncbi:MAG: endonuclease/exonuclease/phosphatase family protein [Bacteroidales bacterium]|nr:endonuclease/exonuclease/phosphatase family protein [Bacteroidales bacterium]
MGRKRHDRTVGITARTLMLLAAFLLFLTYSSMVVNPAKAWYMTVLGLLFIPIVLLNILLLFWAVKRKSKSFMIPLIVLLPSAIFIGRYFQFSSGAAEQSGETSVRMVSYNVGHFMLGSKPAFKGDKGRKACMDSVVRFIKETDADIVCLQEVDLDGEYDVSKFIKDHFPEYQSGYFMFINKEGAYGNVTLSRYPITGKGRLQFEKSSNLAIYTDLKIGDQVLRVYNCHFESYNISLTNLVKSWNRDSTLVRDTEEKMKRSITRRPVQVDQVMSDIEECPVEAIVAGDFNDNPISYTYFRLMKGRKDTFVEAGRGFGATYSGLWPFIRIDYILYPSHFKAASNHIPRLGYSDHYPVVAEILL